MRKVVSQFIFYSNLCIYRENKYLKHTHHFIFSYSQKNLKLTSTEFTDLTWKTWQKETYLAETDRLGLIIPLTAEGRKGTSTDYILELLQPSIRQMVFQLSTSISIF